MVNSLEDLQKLFKLCRKQGVTDIDLGLIKIKFGEPPRKEFHVEQEGESAELTPYELLNYNVSGALDADLQS